MLERDRAVVLVVFRWPMDDRERHTPDYYREKAEEIRRVARQACSPEVIRELRRFAVGGEVNESGDAATVTHKEITGRQVFLRKVGNRWFLEDRQKPK